LLLVGALIPLTLACLESRGGSGADSWSREPFVGQRAEDERGAETPYGTQWYLHEIRATEVWSRLPGIWPPPPDRAPVIGIVDFGFRTTHAELSGVLNMTKAFNACDGSGRVDEGNKTFHGTAVAGLLAGRRNGAGILGVAFDAEVWPIQATCETPEPGDPWVEAIDWFRGADAHGRRKVLLLEVEAERGFNIEDDSPALPSAIRSAVDEGIVVVVPAGNGGTATGLDRSGRATEETGAIQVGATTYGTRRRAPFSNYGVRVVVSAPGDMDHDLTISDERDDAYVRGFGGTSGAAAKVAGVVALMLSGNNRLTPGDVRTILGSAGRVVESEGGKPVGRALDAYAAVKAAIAAPGAAQP
jgi:subtilisin family serine protease